MTASRGGSDTWPMLRESWTKARGCSLRWAQMPHPHPHRLSMDHGAVRGQCRRPLRARGRALARRDRTGGAGLRCLVTHTHTNTHGVTCELAWRALRHHRLALLVRVVSSARQSVSRMWRTALFPWHPLSARIIVPRPRPVVRIRRHGGGGYRPHAVRGRPQSSSSRCSHDVARADHGAGGYDCREPLRRRSAGGPLALPPLHATGPPVTAARSPTDTRVVRQPDAVGQRACGSEQTATAADPAV